MSSRKGQTTRKKVDGERGSHHVLIGISSNTEQLNFAGLEGQTKIASLNNEVRIHQKRCSFLIGRCSPPWRHLRALLQFWLEHGRGEHERNLKVTLKRLNVEQVTSDSGLEDIELLIDQDSKTAREILVTHLDIGNIRNIR